MHTKTENWDCKRWETLDGNPPRPIKPSSQSTTGVRLCCAFCQPFLWKRLGQNHFAKPNWHGLTFLHLKYTVQCTCGVALRECIQWNIFPGLIVCSVTLIMKVIRVTKPADISHRSQQNPGHKLIIRIDRYVQVPFFKFSFSFEQVLHLDSEGIFQRVHVCQIGHWWAIWSSYAFCAHYLDYGVPIE